MALMDWLVSLSPKCPENFHLNWASRRHWCSSFHGARKRVSSAIRFRHPGDIYCCRGFVSSPATYPSAITTWCTSSPQRLSSMISTPACKIKLPVFIPSADIGTLTHQTQRPKTSSTGYSPVCLTEKITTDAISIKRPVNTFLSMSQATFDWLSKNQSATWTDQPQPKMISLNIFPSFQSNRHLTFFFQSTTLDPDDWSQVPEESKSDRVMLCWTVDTPLFFQLDQSVRNTRKKKYSFPNHYRNQLFISGHFHLVEGP